MVFHKEFFVKIVSLDKISDERIFNILSRNIDKSFIKIIKAEEISFQGGDYIEKKNKRKQTMLKDK